MYVAQCLHYGLVVVNLQCLQLDLANGGHISKPCISVVVLPKYWHSILVPRLAAILWRRQYLEKYIEDSLIRLPGLSFQSMIQLGLWHQRLVTPLS